MNENTEFSNLFLLEAICRHNKDNLTRLCVFRVVAIIIDQ